MSIHHTIFQELAQNLQGSELQKSIEAFTTAALLAWNTKPIEQAQYHFLQMMPTTGNQPHFKAFSLRLHPSQCLIIY
ncbi:hypothetical protein [Pasteurella testudinis]|uniref:hypothetical protein n=1 Tax=Pasteurella testudinis TaxID=761 RepID=UPI00117D5B9C|nr:hypothetical protein [Pasteurella testudinis]